MKHGAATRYEGRAEPGGQDAFRGFLFFSASLASGPLEHLGKCGERLPAMERRIRRECALTGQAAWFVAGRDAIHADDGLLGLAGSEWDVGGAGTRTTPGGNTGAARQPARFVAVAGRRGGGHLV